MNSSLGQITYRQGVKKKIDIDKISLATRKMEYAMLLNPNESLFKMCDQIKDIED